MDGKIVYLAVSLPDQGYPEIIGIFDSAENANRACIEEIDGYGPLTINERAPLGVDVTEWIGFTFPRLPQPITYLGYIEDENSDIVDHDTDENESEVDMVG